jgi:hypothetical protein
MADPTTPLDATDVTEAAPTIPTVPSPVSQLPPPPAFDPPPPPAQKATVDALSAALTYISGNLSGNAMALGQAAIEALASIDLQLPEIVSPSLDIPTVTLAGTPGPDAPSDLSVVLPEAPVAPSLPEPRSLGDLDVPQYDLSAPLLIDVPLPDPFDLLVPGPPELGDVSAPVEPDFTLPAVPDLVALALPDAPSFDVPTFTDEAPAPILPPELEFTWAEVEYQSDLLADVNSRLLALVQGAWSALPVEVEQRIWDKSVDEAAPATARSVDEAAQQVAARGFALPGGEMVRLVQGAVNAGIDHDRDASRELMTAQARMQVANFAFAFSNAMQLEGQLIALYNQVQQRALDGARYRVEAAMQLFDARVNLYQAEVQAFGAKAEVFKARLTAVLSRLDLYKAELEAVKAKGQLNVQLAQQYTAQVEGVKAIADVYRARVSAVSLAVANNKNRTELYKSQVDGAAARAKGAAFGVQAYLAQLQNEHAKADLFNAQVAGYTSQIEAYRALVEGKLADAGLQFRQQQQFPLELYKSQIAQAMAQTRAEAAEIAARAEVLVASTDKYAATQRMVDKIVAVGADVEGIQIKAHTALAQAVIAGSGIAERASLMAAQATQAAALARAQSDAQIAAARISSVHVSTSFSHSNSNSNSTALSQNKITSTTNSISQSNSASNNISTSFSNTTGGTSSYNESQTYSENETNSDTANNSISNIHSQTFSNDSRNETRNTNSANSSLRMEVTNQHIYNHKA